jgi:hypothetical protein
LFTERAYTLLANSGHLGYIIPNNWLTISTMKTFRDFLVGSTGNLCIVNNLFKVFRGANVDTSIVSFQKTAPSRVTLLEATDPTTLSEISSVDPQVLLNQPIISIRKGELGREGILAKMKECSLPLGYIALVKSGLVAYETGKGIPPQTDAVKKGRVYHSTDRASNAHRIYLDGQDVKRYSIEWSGMYLKYGRHLAAPRDPALYEGERILVRQIPSALPLAINGAIVCGEELNDRNSMIVKSNGLSNKYILGIINSRLLSFWFNLTFDKFQRAIFPQFKVNELAQFPMRKINSDHADRTRQDQIVAKVDEMLDAKKLLAQAVTDKDKAFYEGKCAAIDRQIDRLVYTLYGLTDSEIAIVEVQNESKPVAAKAPRQAAKTRSKEHVSIFAKAKHQQSKPTPVEPVEPVTIFVVDTNYARNKPLIKRMRIAFKKAKLPPVLVGRKGYIEVSSKLTEDQRVIVKQIIGRELPPVDQKKFLSTKVMSDVGTRD